MKIHLDNSAFSLLSCSRKFQLRVVEGKKEGKNDQAAFGDGVHKALEFLDKGESPEAMLAHIHKLSLGIDIPKVLSLVTYYKMARTLPPPIVLENNSPAVELKFSHKYASIMLSGSHEILEVYLEGTIDRLHIDDDVLVLLDYKTTAAATPYLLDKALASYALSFQPAFYLFALKNFGILPASYLDYIKNRKYRIEIHLLAYNTSPPTFKKHIRHAFNDDFIDREVPLIVNSRIGAAVEIVGMTGPAPHTGMCVYKACDNCGYRPACLVMGEAREDEILSRYEVNPYQPLSFR